MGIWLKNSPVSKITKFKCYYYVISKIEEKKKNWNYWWMCHYCRWKVWKGRTCFHLYLYVTLNHCSRKTTRRAVRWYMFWKAFIFTFFVEIWFKKHKKTRRNNQFYLCPLSATWKFNPIQTFFKHFYLVEKLHKLLLTFVTFFLRLFNSEYKTKCQVYENIFNCLTTI